jgi:hypothetical protein
MISTFEQVWDRIDGENKPYPDILEKLQEEISQREDLIHATHEARGFKELTKEEQERMAFIQVKYGIQDLPLLDNGKESEIWKAALAKRADALERERQENSAESWEKRIDDHRSEIEDAIWKASSRAQEGVPGTYNAIVRFKGRALLVYSMTRTEEERDIEDPKFEMSSSQAAKIIDEWKKKFLESVAKDAESQEAGNDFANTAYQEPEMLREQGTAQTQRPNMAEVQAAEMKASVIESLDKSADGNTQIEGQDIGYAEEGYVAAATQVKYEAQRARTADNEQQTQDTGIEESISPKIGQRVTFQAHGTKTKLVGKVVDMDDETVTLQSGRALIPALRDKGTFTEAPELDATHTKKFAQEQAQKHVGEHGSVFLAKNKGSYKGTIVELTPTFAIQKVNSETAILHRLKDLEVQEKNGHGELKDQARENEEFYPHLIRAGQDVSITRESLRNGGVVIEPWDREREEKQRVREQERSRGSQSR